MRRAQDMKRLLRRTNRLKLRQALQRRARSTLRLTKLICHKTTNWFNDNVLLNVWSHTNDQFGFGTKKGGEYRIDTQCEFQDKAHVLLREKNTREPNDTLGFQTIVEKTTSAGSLYFNDDGASYELQYTVEPLTTEDDTQALVNTGRAELHIKSLICFENEEFSKDEIDLRFRDAFSDKPAVYRESVNSGDVWHLNKKHLFGGSAYLTLSELDHPSPDDRLGTHIVTPHFGKNKTIDFTQHDTAYRLIYSINPAVNDRDYTPLQVIPKEVTHEGGAKIWVGAFNRLSQGATWQCSDKQGEVVLQGEIAAWEWQHVQPAEDYPTAAVSFQHVHLNKKVLKSDTAYQFTVNYGTAYATAAAEFKTLPSAIPVGLDNAYQIFAGSCFDYTMDSGRVSEAYQQVFHTSKPHQLFFMGDTIYNDAPADQHIAVRYTKSELAAMLHQKYQLTWDALGRVMQSGFNYNISDDHERWNGAPFPPAFMLGVSESYLQTWGTVANSFFKALQSQSLVKFFSIGKDLSFCVADTTLRRDKIRKNLLPDKEFEKVTDWLTTLKSPGVLVISQPLLLEKKAGYLFNREANIVAYEQYRTLANLISQSKYDIVVLSGDVHYSRFASIPLEKATLYEVITSPLSLVEFTPNAGDTSLLNDAAELASAGRWRLTDDRKPTRFPDKSVSQTRFPVHYEKAGRAKLDEFTGDTAPNRTEENFAQIRFFKESAEAKHIRMRVDTWLPRVKDGSGKIQKDWDHEVTLRTP